MGKLGFALLTERSNQTCSFALGCCKTSPMPLRVCVKTVWSIRPSQWTGARASTYRAPFTRTTWTVSSSRKAPSNGSITEVKSQAVSKCCPNVTSTCKQLTMDWSSWEWPTGKVGDTSVGWVRTLCSVIQSTSMRVSILYLVVMFTSNFALLSTRNMFNTKWIRIQKDLLGLVSWVWKVQSCNEELANKAIGTFAMIWFVIVPNSFVSLQKCHVKDRTR